MYKHTQFSWMLLALVALALAGVFPVKDQLPLSFLIGLFTFSALLLSTFSSLTIDVRNALRLHFGFGPIFRNIKFDQIANAKAVRNHWLMGWGIHYYGEGWLWNVWGLDAIEIEFKNGKKFRVGTDQPQELLAAISSRLAH